MELQLADGTKDLESALAELTEHDLILLRWRILWQQKARPSQIPPDNFSSLARHILLIRAGRGWGKTLTGANWLGIQAASYPGEYGVIGPTRGDTRYTMFYGVSGLYTVIPKELIHANTTEPPTITLKNKSFIRGFSGDSPERLRGPGFRGVWADEIGSWLYPEDAMDNIELALREGDDPLMMITGTPKPTPFIRELVSRSDVIDVTGSSYENRDNLTPAFFNKISKYEGTTVGRQEIHGEILDPEEEGLVKRSQWKLWPNDKPLPEFQFIIMSLDTAFTERQHDKKTQKNDPTACSVWGLFNRQLSYDPRTNTRRLQKNIMLLDCWEDYLGFPDLVRKVKSERRIRYGDAGNPVIKATNLPRGERAGHQGRPIDMILIENKASGISLRQSLAEEDILTECYNPGNEDKLTRLHLISHLWAHGRVWAVESDKSAGKPKTWADPLISQVCSYTGEGSIKHDDLLDTCVVFGTPVITAQGIKPIGDIRVGDRVLTHKGRFMPVVRLMQRETKDLYTLKTKCLETLQITGNHPVYVASVTYKKQRYKQVHAPLFKRVDELTPKPAYTFKRKGQLINSRRASPHDAVLLPVPMEDIKNTHLSIPIVDHPRAKSTATQIPLNEETGFVFGLFSADGGITLGRNSQPGNVWFSGSRVTIDRIKATLADAFGVDDGCEEILDTHVRLVIGRQALAERFSDFGYPSKNKIIPEWVFSASTSFIKGFIDGYVEGDGCVHDVNNIGQATSVSLSLLWGVRLLLLRLNINSTLHVSKPEGQREIFEKKCDCQVSYGLRWQVVARNDGTLIRAPDGSSAGYYVESVTLNENEQATVYNLQVAEDESYVTTGGTVHNCSQALRLMNDKFFGPFTVKGLDERREREEAEAEHRRSVKTNPYGT